MPPEAQLRCHRNCDTAVQLQKRPAHFMRGLRSLGRKNCPPSGEKNAALSGGMIRFLLQRNVAAQSQMCTSMPLPEAYSLSLRMSFSRLALTIFVARRCF